MPSSTECHTERGNPQSTGRQEPSGLSRPELPSPLGHGHLYKENLPSPQPSHPPFYIIISNLHAPCKPLIPLCSPSLLTDHPTSREPSDRSSLSFQQNLTPSPSAGLGFQLFSKFKSCSCSYVLGPIPATPSGASPSPQASALQHLIIVKSL